MPPYLKSCLVNCPFCGKPATVELYTSTNALVGKFCKPCGDAKLREVQASEQATK